MEFEGHPADPRDYLPAEPGEHRLPEWLAQRIEDQGRKGITIGVERDGDGHWTKRTSIHWKPGDPNSLAAAIIKHVHKPMLLSLDGHKYRIEPEDGGEHE